MKKRKLLLVLPAAVLALGSCSFQDFIDKITGKEPEQKEPVSDDPSGEQEKEITDVQLVDGQTFSVVQNGTLNPSNVKVLVYYNDRTNEEKAAERVEVDTSTVGTVTGTAYYKDWDVEITVTVISQSEVVHVTGMSYQVVGNRTIEVGETSQVNITVEPENATDKSVTFRSSNEAIATVSATGEVVGVAAGEVNIIVTSNDNSDVSKTISFTVKEVQATLPNETASGFTKLTASESLEVGEIVNFAGAVGNKFYGMGPTDGNFINATEIQKENDKLVTTDELAYTAIKNADNTYSFADKNGKFLTAFVDKNYLVGDTEITNLSKFDVTVKEDGSVTVKAVDSSLSGKACVLCLNENNGNPRFSLYKEASVGGMNKVYLYHNGIKNDGSAVESVSFTESSFEVEVGRSVTVNAVVSPATAENKEVTYSLENVTPAGCVTISGNTLTGVAEGTATVVATSVADDTKKATAAVTIIPEKQAKHAGTLADPFDKDDALLVAGKLASGAVSENEYYIKDTVTQLKEAFDSKFGNYTFYFGDFLCYRMKYGEKKANFTSAEDLKAGDVVTICAKLTNYQGTLETKEGQGYVVDIARAGEAVTSVTLDKEETSISVEKTVQLNATVAPIYAEDKTITWSVSPEDVASVENGLVTGLKAGEATVTATSGDKTANCIVKVSAQQIAPGSVLLDKETAKMMKGGTLTLNATVLPEGADQAVTWSSTNESVATVENGVVTALKAGETTILAEANGTVIKGSCVVTVYETSRKGTADDPYTVSDAKTIFDTLDDNANTSEVYVTGTIAASPAPTVNKGRGTVYVTDGTETIQAFSINNIGGLNNLTVDMMPAGYIVVMKGAIKRYVTQSDTTFELCYVNGVANCEFISITAPVYNVTGVSIPETMTITTGATDAKLTATITPENATNKNVSWSSSNESVATIDENGNITPVAAGETTITVTTADGGLTDTCVLTVQAGSIGVTGVTLDEESVALNVGETKTLVATVAPEGATDKSVTWTSSEETVATVENGVVTAVGAGTATITVTTTDGEFSDTCEITVSELTPIVNPATYFIKHGEFFMSAEKGSKGQPLATKNEEEALKLEFVLQENTEDQYKIKASGTNDYLYLTKDNNGLRLGSTQMVWTISEGTAGTDPKTGFNITGKDSDGATRVITLYNDTDFRTYVLNGDGSASNRLCNSSLQQYIVKTLESISVTTAPTKTSYLVGEELDTNGLIVKGHYVWEGGSEDREITGYTISQSSAFTEADISEEKAITVTYNDLTTTFYVEVKADERVVSSIRIDGDMIKKDYYVGGNWNPEGLSVKVVYSDDTEDLLDSEAYTLSYNPANAINTEVTSVTVTATLNDDPTKTAEKTINVTVNAKPVFKGATYTFDEAKKTTTALTTDKFTEALIKNANGDSVIKGCSAISNSYIGANGGSGDAKWELAGCLKLGKGSGGYGSVTLTLDSDIEFSKIKVSVLGWADECKLSVGGTEQSFKNKASNSNLTPTVLEFDITSGASSLTIASVYSSGNLAVLVTAIEFVA